jgi:aryl-alcohol dehydrogenase-like predicted oxidoreductase
MVAGTTKLGGDIEINRMGFGTMRLPGPGVWGEPTDPANAKTVLRRAFEYGVNYFDTAAYYGPEVANRLLREAFYPYPPGLVIGTKVGAVRAQDKSWHAAARPDELRIAVEDNLRELKLERLDLVHMRYHPDDANCPFAESLGVLADMQSEGKIRHIGVSNISEIQLMEALELVAVASVQNLYNLSNRTSERIVDLCSEKGIVFMPFFPLAIGKIDDDNRLLALLAENYGVSPFQLALAWLLARSPVMLTIPGTASLAHLAENIAAASIELAKDDYMSLAAGAE